MNNNKLNLLNCIFVTSLVIANVLASKLVIIGGHFIVPAAVVAYAFTFLCTDVIGELYGKQEANKTVRLGLICQIFSTILIIAAIHLPIAPFMADFQGAYKSVLGSTARMTLASLVAYIFAQANDVYVFHLLKDKHKGKNKWIRNNLSTICSQFIDTAIFVTIGFWGIAPDLWTLIYSQFAVKIVLAFIDTPFFYMLTRNKK